MGEVENKLKNSVFRIHDEITELIPSVNGIISNDSMVTMSALGSIQRATRSLEGFVEITEGYPKQDYTEVTFKTDLIVLKTAEYERILTYIKELEDGNQ